MSLKQSIGVMLVLSLLTLAAPARADWWPDGWYGNDEVPRPGSYPDLEMMEVKTWWDTAAPATVVSIAVVRGYQLLFSRYRKGDCPFVPSCSRYGLQALQAYGAFWGWLMTVDRIFYRENSGIYKNFPRVSVGRWDKPYDPPTFDYIWTPPPWPLVGSDLEEPTQ